MVVQYSSILTVTEYGKGSEEARTLTPAIVTSNFYASCASGSSIYAEVQHVLLTAAILVRRGQEPEQTDSIAVICNNNFHTYLSLRRHCSISKTFDAVFQRFIRAFGPEKKQIDYEGKIMSHLQWNFRSKKHISHGFQ
ncbi:hypothetical protein RHGRI_004283 [Rhododendron griersonianum]|uniref:Uncharacterized protein n=1 Tax=Rhododendron griersonianum TaxID=479676 RepID=A0AAV6L828_9ERIC|nr:hypothetical protein RHGRI_004283 [Rhododendron griersonianum]